MHSDSLRQALGRASLSCGRIMETTTGAGEDILDIVKAVGRLNAVADGLGTVAPQAPGAGSTPAAIESVRKAAAALEQKSSAIHELTEESNGLALNMALMAARGEAGEKDLAQFAEKLRSSAERFGRLGRELGQLAKSFVEQSAGAGAGAEGAVSAAGSLDAAGGIREISKEIEARSRSLQQKMTSVGNDIEEIRSVLALEGEKSTETGERINATDGSMVNFGSDAGDSGGEPGGIDDSDLVIDHGKVWEDSPFTPGESAEAEVEARAPDSGFFDGEAPGEKGDFLVSGFREAMGTMSPGADQSGEDAVASDDAPDARPAAGENEKAGAVEPEALEKEAPAEPSAQAREEEIVAEVVEEAAVAAAERTVGEPASRDDWNEMQAAAPGPGETDGQEWIEDHLEAAAAGENTVSGQLRAEAPAGAPQVHETVSPMPRGDSPGAVPAGETEEAEDDQDPIYDLFELGAVEYVEETNVNL